ncbi:MAG TPA: hypothetical protein VFO01_04250 [Trebonia sp.]|nr:hypothetical protein [Trebonia sp.]
MSDSFPSDDEGSGPCAAQDLDGLLSGENRCTPETLRPLVQALDALRAPPMRSELLGEAAARAYFRKIVLGGESEPARPDAGAGEPHTLILPAVTPRGEPRLAGRRRRHRRPPQRGRWQAKGPAGVAAAVVIVGAVALAAALSSSGGRPAGAGTSLRAAGTKSSAAPRSNGVDGSGTLDPGVNPAHSTTAPQKSGNGPSPTELCDKYFGFLLHPGQEGNQVTKIYRQLSSLADGQNVAYYCLQLQQPWAAPQGPGKSPGIPGDPFPGSLPGSQGQQGPQGSHGSQGSQGAHGAGSSPGPGGNGNAGSGNGSGQGKNSPGGGAKTGAGQAS